MCSHNIKNQKIIIFHDRCNVIFDIINYYLLLHVLCNILIEGLNDNSIQNSTPAFIAFVNE